MTDDSQPTERLREEFDGFRADFVRLRDEIAGRSDKIRDELDRTTVIDYARAHGLEVVGEIPYDDDLRRAEQQRVAPLDTEAKALEGMERLATALAS